MNGFLCGLFDGFSEAMEALGGTVLTVFGLGSIGGGITLTVLGTRDVRPDPPMPADPVLERLDQQPMAHPDPLLGVRF